MGEIYRGNTYKFMMEIHGENQLGGFDTTTNGRVAKKTLQKE